MGYYQPTEVQDNLFSFEVYGSLEECKEDWPNENISTYFNDDIEDCLFVDELLYDSEWNWLMPVVEKIKNIGTTSLSTDEEYSLLDNLDDSLIVVRMDLIYDAVIEFIKRYNKQKQ